ncbi:MAG: 50S ribosomal protein L4 [bacterium]|nr:50S ribosomal protein L4 [bacterium]
MTIDVYTATGTKKGTAELPASLFKATVNEDLMHQALVRQQSNRRHSIAHVKGRGEVRGSTKKLYAQKGTGRARRGSVRSPVLRGGGKAFGPRNNSNFTKDMPKAMRRAALKSCLTLQANSGAILALESYPDTIKTKDMNVLLSKLPVELGRKIVIVTSKGHTSLALSARNIPGVKTISAAYLNPEDILGAHRMIFLVDAIKTAEEVFTSEGTKEAKGTKVETRNPQPATRNKSESSKVSKKDAPPKA